MSSNTAEVKVGLQQLHEDVIPQLSEISLDSKKPLLISDADEVILDFLGAFEKYLLSHDLRFDLSTYSLFGNILEIKNNNPISKEEVISHLDNFFDIHTKDISIVNGALENLKKIEDELNCQIIILTNIPLKGRQDRIHCFQTNNLNYPIITNVNSKGPTIREIINNFKSSDLSEIEMKEIFDDYISALIFNEYYIENDINFKISEKAINLFYNKNIKNQSLNKTFNEEEIIYLKYNGYIDLVRKRIIEDSLNLKKYFIGESK